MIDTITFLYGGGPASSPNNIGQFTALGENLAASGELSSAKFNLLSGQLFLLVPSLREGLRWIISDLRAKEGIFGALIPEATWQKDNDPYFYWDILTVPANLIKGFSISLDNPPDLTIDTDSTSYQFPEHAIASGKHTFFVLPFVSKIIAVQDSLLKFDIWVDVDLPVINNLSPSPGQITPDNHIPISCYLFDQDSGLDLNLTTLTLNNETAPYQYDSKKQALNLEPQFLPEGRNTVLLKAVDAVGNYTVKAWEFIVDTQPPVGSILINNGQKITNSAYVSINIDCSDSVSGVKNIYISNDGVFDTELNHPYAYTPLIKDWLVSEPNLDGLKTVFVKFQDAAGNLSESFKAAITLKLLTPDTRIISGPASITKEVFADFIFEATKPGCLFRFKLDNQDWSEWSDSREAHFSGLAEGNHYFYVKAGFDLDQDKEITIDEEDATPASWVWAIKPEGLLEKLRERILFWRR